MKILFAFLIVLCLTIESNAETNLGAVAELVMDGAVLKFSAPERLEELPPDLALMLPDGLYYFWATSWNNNQYRIKYKEPISNVITTTTYYENTANIGRRGGYWNSNASVSGSATVLNQTHHRVFDQREGYLPAIIYNPYSRGNNGQEAKAKSIRIQTTESRSKEYRTKRYDLVRSGQ